jgi:general secretion pathway protein A
MSVMPTDLFGLTENPFADVRDPRFLYPSRSHREAVAHLGRAIGNREPFALLTGLPGVGRTTAVETALAGAGPHTRVTLPASPALTREQFLERVLAGFAPEANPARPTEGLEARLRALRAAGRAAVLVVEEAQDLGQPLLDDLRLYSNLEADGHALLQIVLEGQPALEERLADPACDALRARIGVGCRLAPLSNEETEGYVRHRIAVAGGEVPSLFATEACQALHRLTHGIPREINQLASEALALAGTAGEDRIVAGHVACAVVLLGFRSAARDLPLPAEAPAPVEEEPVETTLRTEDHPAPVGCAGTGTTPAAPQVHSPTMPREAEPVACVAEPVVRVAEPSAAVAEATAAPATPSPRHAGRRRQAPARDRSPRHSRAPRTTVLTAAALLVVAAGGFLLANSTRNRVQPRPTATPVAVTSASEPTVAHPATTPTARPTPAHVRAAPVRPATPAETRQAPATPEHRYAVEVATFISESRAMTERDRLAAVISLPCTIVASDEDGYAVVVGPVASSREATRLSVDLSNRGVVGQARVVRWAASGSTRR